MADLLSNRFALAALVALNAEQASRAPFLRDEMQDLRRRLNEIEGRADERSAYAVSGHRWGKALAIGHRDKIRAKAKAARKARKITRRNRK
ncbi:hypothetical protein [Chachezhania sediminis]|uniref:hypothetical protein n=1 Tax=Chachezhania sediminis TaxID=2599291 RepID=UPI00131C2B35|nr:hypothetical protein [Chachezhania sediminis]